MERGAFVDHDRVFHTDGDPDRAGRPKSGIRPANRHEINDRGAS